MVLELVSESMSNNGHQISGLPESSVDLIRLDLGDVIDFPKSETTDGSELIMRGNIEYLVDKVGFPMLLIQILQVLNLAFNLLNLIQLVGVFSLIVIDFLPNVVLLLLDHVFSPLQFFKHLIGFFIFLLHIFQLLIKLLLLLFEILQPLLHGLQPIVVNQCELFLNFI